MARYGIATLFEDCEDGYEFTSEDTPLHLTHVDVVDVNLSPDVFTSKLKEHLNDQPKFNIIPVENSFLGPNKDIPVTVIELTPELKAFHERLIDFLKRNGAIFENPHFVGAQYAPHVSIYGQRSVSLGEPISVNSVSIGNKRTDIDNPPNRIIATIPLL